MDIVQVVVMARLKEFVEGSVVKVIGPEIVILAIDSGSTGPVDALLDCAAGDMDWGARCSCSTLGNVYRCVDSIAKLVD